MPEISVIVPVYNVENKITRCIDSILTQTFTDYELILVDDGSSDRSGEICDEYAANDHRIKVIHQKNAGPSAARNAGIRVAEGAFIAFVDSDDYVHCNYLGALYDHAIKYNADMVKCNYYTVSENGMLNECKHKYSNETVFDKRAIKDYLYHDVFYNTNTTGYFSLWNKLIRRQTVIDNSISMDETMFFGEDMLFVMEYLKYCDTVVFIDELIYYYEALPSGLFFNYRRSFLNDIMKCYTALIEQTRHDQVTNNDYLPLSIKYWYYVNRYICGIVENESNKNMQIRKVLSDPRVKTMFTRIAVLNDDEIANFNIAKNEMRVPRLVANNKTRQAAFVARYQFDSDFWFRRLRSTFHLCFDIWIII